MRFIVVCDEKPIKCEDCPLYHDTLEKTKNKSVMEIVSRCFLDDTRSIESCPLTEVNTLFKTREN